MTLLFSKVQAIACAQAKVQLISPFVGRIYDWFKAGGQPVGRGRHGRGQRPRRALGARDLPVLQALWHCHRGDGRELSQRGQIVALAGCDLLTIAPELLGQSEASTAPVLPALDAQAARQLDMAPVHYDEASFRFALNEDAMATEKLAEGIRAFAVDTRKLEDLLRQAGAGA